jgi:hypothetical protein
VVEKVEEEEEEEEEEVERRAAAGAKGAKLDDVLYVWRTRRYNLPWLEARREPPEHELSLTSRPEIALGRSHCA